MEASTLPSDFGNSVQSLLHILTNITLVVVKRSPSRAILPVGHRWSTILWPSAGHQPKQQDDRHGPSVSHGVPVYHPDYTGTKLCCSVTEAWMCANDLSKVALDSTASGFEPAISARKSNALTTTSPSHYWLITNDQAKRKRWKRENKVNIIAGNGEKSTPDEKKR